MFITAMAANPLAVNLAAEAIGETISWGTWALAGVVPGTFALLTMPLLMYILYPPEKKDTPDAPKEAQKQLDSLGPMSINEKITAGAFAVTVGLWVGGAAIGINAVAAALVGLTILLVTGVVSWKECLSNNGAWDTLTWFAALIAMASHLNKFGFIPWFSEQVRTAAAEVCVCGVCACRGATLTLMPSLRGQLHSLPHSAGRWQPCAEAAAFAVQVVGIVGGLGLPWASAFAVVAVLYFYSHYLFASGAAHIGAMYTAFLSVSIACGAPALPAALMLGQLSNLMGCLTTYGIGSAPPYFSSGYVPQSKWYQYGFLLSIYYLFVWFVIGGAWWKFIGIL